MFRTVFMSTDLRTMYALHEGGRIKSFLHLLLSTCNWANELMPYNTRLRITEYIINQERFTFLKFKLK